MRKLTALLLALALTLGLSTAFADTKITVTGSGEVLIPADVAVISLGVNVRSAEAPSAQAEANEVIAKIREALTAAGIDEEDISTGYINLYAAYDYSSSVERITGYNASSTLAVKVTDMSRVGEVIDLAFGAGANMLDGVSFSAKDDTAARAEALKAAVADAKAKADVLAEAAGLGKLELENITEGGVYAYDSGANNFSAKGMITEQAEDAATVIRAAKICVSASVTITYEAKEKK